MTNEEFEPIRIRIMQEAYDLADRNDTEGYNSVKVMCGDVQNLIQREWVGLTDEEIGGLTVFDGLHHIETPLLAEYVLHIQVKLREKNGG